MSSISRLYTQRSITLETIGNKEIGRQQRNRLKGQSAMDKLNRFLAETEFNLKHS